MRKFLKILGVLLTLPVVAAVCLFFLVDPDDYKQVAQAEFFALTGYELVVDGGLRASLFPKPVLEMTAASVFGASGTEGPALLRLSSVRFYPRLFSLLTRRLELELVRAEGLRLQLIRNEQGRGSWETVEEVPPPLDRSAGAVQPWVPAWPATPPGPFDVLAGETSPEPDGLVIGSIEILDGRVTWNDRRSGRRLAIDGLKVFAGPVASDSPMAWRMSGFLRNVGPGPSARLRAEGSFGAGSSLQRPRLEPVMLELRGFDLRKGITADLVLRAAVEADLDAQRFLANGLSLEIQASGEGLPGGRIKAVARARLDLDLNAERLEVGALSVRSGTLMGRGTILGQSLLSTPAFTGDLAVDELDLRAWLEQRGLRLPRTADAETFRSFSLSTRWRLEDARLGLQDLTLKVDQTALTGEVEPVAGNPRGYRFDLIADQMDLDRYMLASEQARPASGKKSSQLAPAPKSLASRAASTEQLPSAPPVEASGPVSAPRPERFSHILRSIPNLRLEGRLRIGELNLERLRFGDADMQIRVKDSRIDIDHQVQRFYGGRLEGTLGLDESGAQPGVALAQRAEGIQTGSLLADLTGEDRLTGRGSIAADLTARGKSVDALRRSLAGNLTIHIPKGGVKGFNLERVVRDADARLRGKRAPTDLPTETEFKDFRASAEVQSGVLRNRDLVVSTDHFRVTGSGTVDLAEERFDYRFEPLFVKPPKGRGIRELEGIPIPVHLSGPFDHPRWDVDLGAALRAAAERQLNEQGEDLFQKLEERTGIKGLEQGLKSLFGR
jgi:AsmA protein